MFSQAKLESDEKEIKKEVEDAQADKKEVQPNKTANLSQQKSGEKANDEQQQEIE